MELFVKRKFILLFSTIFIVGGLLFFASNALALDPLVPCGRAGQPACTTCDLLVLGKNISDFILFYLVPAIAALLFIYAGFSILLGGGIPSRVQAGQNIFRTTAYGLMIIFLAWLIVNTTLRTVAGDQNIAQDWWKLECKETIPATTTTTTETSTSTTIAEETTTSSTTTTTVSSSTSSFSTTTVRPGSTTTTIPGSSSTTTTKPTTTTTTTNPPTTTTQRSTTTTSAPLACMFQGVNYSTFNICGGLRRPGGCGNSTCAQYLPSINKYAGGAASVRVLKAFMVIESDCNPTRVSYDGSSFGLMQFKPETANTFKSRCGITENVTSSWLVNPVNADKSICLAAAYINSIAAGSCGSSPGGIYAGYNAGAGWCRNSNDCSGQQSCAGGAMKMWECPYDNPQHTACNEGLYQTKQGASYINYCINNLGF